MGTDTYAVTAGAAAPLGVTLVEGGVNVAVVSRNADWVAFCLFDARGDVEIARLPLPGRSGDVFHGFVAGVGEGARYGLRADGPYRPDGGHRFDPAMLLADPYATELDRPFAYQSGLGLPRATASDSAALMPKAIIRPAVSPASRPSPRPAGLIYELPVRAFSMRHPGIPAEIRGTVAALAEPAVIEHLQHIGVDTIELMPIAAWIDERHLSRLGLHNAWGYNPVTFMAPDPRLAPGGMAEVRRTLDALHAAGFRIVLDIVFNHSGEGDDEGPTLSFRGLDNALYYRHSADNPGRMINDTGCGNTIALDRAPVVRLAMDALRHWARAGFDGFRFDLAPVMGRLPGGFSPDAPLLAAMAQDPELSGLMLIAEPWDVGPGGYQLGNFAEPWAEWNDHYRDGVRGFWRGDAGAAADFATRLAGSSDIFARSRRGPSRGVNFIAAHDGFSLADLTAYAGKHNEANGEQNRDGTDRNLSWNCGVEGSSTDPAVLAMRQRDVRALLATLLVSRGTPMLTAGDEFGRTQRGNNNAYAQDNEATWLDWIVADESLIGLVGRLGDLRRRHAALRANRFLDGRAPEPDEPKDAVWLKRDGSPMGGDDWRSAEADVLGLALFEPDEANAKDDRLCLWFNRTRDPVAVTMPAPRAGSKWRIEMVSTGQAAETGSGLVVPARSVMVCAET